MGVRTTDKSSFSPYCPALAHPCTHAHHTQLTLHLTPVTATPTPVAQDNLALHAINFLTAVSRSVHYTLFKDAATLRQICESIVIPNLKMREDMVRARCACFVCCARLWCAVGALAEFL